jgi:uncharacterized membrane protein (UPF0182 family)
MGRDIVDIPEVFRDAFDEDEWDGERGGDGGDGGNGNGGRGDGGSFGRPWWLNRWVAFGLLAILLLLSFNWIVRTYTEWLWFDAQEYQEVWLTQWLVRVVVFVVFFVIAAAVLLVNWRLAYRRAVQATRISLLALPGMNTLVTGGALFTAFLFAAAAGAQWGQFLLYVYRQPFGVDDPIFGIDLSFYLFELPVFRSLHSWFIPLFVITLVGVGTLYLADSWRGLRQGLWRPVFSAAMRRHLAILATIVTLMWALGYWLDIYELMYSSRGVATGASYTDLNAVLPALYAQLAATVLLAIAAAINIFRQALRPLVIAGGLWLVVFVGLGVIYPSALQRYAVEPNELSRERPYIQHNIDFTRLAFGLEEVDARPFGEVSELTNRDLVENRETLQNVRIWDDRPLQLTYAQLQELRPYYEFSPIDIDRYEIDGETRQVMLAGRELNKANLTAPSWVNQKLQFTHGYGVVMNPVDQVTPEGRPDFFIQDLPPKSSVDIDVDRPEIYYGELINDVVFVGSDLEEFDYPVGTTNANSSYEGEGGVELSNILRRLAFAIRFGETNLLLSDYITPETRVLLHRQIRERVRQITPFLAFDNDPYLVVADGRLFWILDGYTLSRNFPYSTPVEQGFNYIRNSVKATVDAYNGTVTYYLVDDEDPLIQAYDRAFPSLFLSLDEMPAELLAHVRYPKDLFSVQTRQYLKYHMADVQVFYNEEDLWEIPQEVFDTAQQPIEPYYVIMSLPGEERTEFLLIEPYTPAGKDNMIAWLAARSDPPHYGELVAYELPKQQLVFGPSQVEARVDQDPEISAQISLWNQRGSRVIRGNLIVIPMGSSFLYVEPLYLLAETSELPELKRVIVASGDRIAMRETLEEALIALIQAGPTVDQIVEEPPVSEVPAEGEVSAEGEQPAEGQVTSPTPTPRSAESPVMDETIQELIDAAGEHFEAAEQAQREGDWAAYGRELEALGAVLQQLTELSEEE